MTPTRHLLCIVICASLIATCANAVWATTSAATAYAVVLENITIDGKLDDWPKDMVRYPVLNNFRAYGQTDLALADLTTSKDLSAWFTVGYSEKENLIYVAVVVRDDKHVVGHRWDTTDAVEIYVTGIHKTGKQQGGRSIHRGLQYAGVAGNGSYAVYHKPTNPSLIGGSIEKTRTKFSYCRQGDLTIYEWAIEAFDRFRNPATPTKLTPGKRIGFDVVVVDKDDRDDAQSCVNWGPMGNMKYYNPGLQGDLVLVDPKDGLNPVSGSVTNRTSGKPFAGVIVQAFVGDDPAGYVRSDDQGRFRFMLPPGRYRLEPAQWQALEPETPVEVKVAQGKPARANLTAIPLPLPDELKKAVGVYRHLKAYQDKSTVVIKLGSGPSVEIPISFAFQRPNHLRVTSGLNGTGTLAIVCDGTQLTMWAGYQRVRKQVAPDLMSIVALRKGRNLPVQVAKLPGQPTSYNIPFLADGIVGTSLVPRLILAEDPMRELMMGVGDVVKLGEEQLEGVKVSLIELTKTSPFAMNGHGFGGTDLDEPNFMRLWISPNDGLIRKVDYQFDNTADHKGARPRDRPKNMLTFAVTYRDIKVHPKFAEDHFQTPAEDEQ